ncbi:hypothetical protein T484DRAFT_1808070, partial [Baffinella frigidus]
SVLDEIHEEACLEVSVEQKRALEQVRARLAALLTGPPAFPPEVEVEDILPNAKSEDILPNAKYPPSTGPPAFPPEVEVEDILPNAKFPQEMCARLEDRLAFPQEMCARLEDHCALIEILNKYRIMIKSARLEDHCALIEILNKNRIMIKDTFRTYASLSLTNVTSLDALEIDEIRTFFKDSTVGNS